MILVKTMRLHGWAFKVSTHLRGVGRVLSQNKDFTTAWYGLQFQPQLHCELPWYSQLCFRSTQCLHIRAHILPYYAAAGFLAQEISPSFSSIFSLGKNKGRKYFVTVGKSLPSPVPETCKDPCVSLL